MKIALPIFLLSFAILASSCSQAAVENNAPPSDLNTAQPAATVPGFEGPSGGPMILRDRYEVIREYVLKDTAEVSRNLGLAPLKRPGRKDDMELRIWTNLGGLGNSKLLGVRSSEGKYSAYFFETDGNTAISGNRNLPAPRSPWTKMLFEVRSRLTTPKGLERDPNFTVSIDEPFIVLEVLDGDTYDMVFYGHFWKNKDGERLISVCEYIASEFGVDPECSIDRDQ